MPSRSSKPKRPRDPNQLAKLIVDIATGQVVEPVDEVDPVREAARLLGRKGGQKGGKARAAALSKAERVAIAKKAAAKRWSKP